MIRAESLEKAFCALKSFLLLSMPGPSVVCPVRLWNATKI